MKNLLLFTVFVFNLTSIFCQPIKVVFTGGPCTGKTTLINALASKGYYIIREAATAVIQEEQKSGNMTPWNNLDQFQLKIVAKQEECLDLALKLSHHKELIFFDRACIDSFAYCKFNKQIIPQELTELLNKVRYDYIFLLDFVKTYSSSGVRHEGMEEARKIHNCLSSVYESLGYNVITVPALTVDERVEFVLDKLRQIHAIE
ncbi:MAG: ATP-binding protein [bacterium]